MKIALMTLLLIAQSVVVLAAGASGKSHRDNTALFPTLTPDKSFATPPPRTKLIAPAFMAKITSDKQKLEWSAATGADAYHVQVATDPNFKWLVVNEHWVKDTSFEVRDLEKEKHYYWRVAGVKSDNDAMYIKNNFVSSMFSTEAATVAK
ncbi:MAG: fibronectin type III domain-containing protein [Pseudobdellovibrionaceae bacterium]